MLQGQTAHLSSDFPLIATQVLPVDFDPNDPRGLPHSENPDLAMVEPENAKRQEFEGRHALVLPAEHSVRRGPDLRCFLSILVCFFLYEFFVEVVFYR